MSKIFTISQTEKVGTRSGQKSGQEINIVPISLSDNEINELRDQSGWLSVKQFAQISGQHERKVKRYCLNGKYVTNCRQIDQDGRRPYQIHFTELPPDGIEQYRKLITGEKPKTAMELAARDEAFRKRGAISFLNRDKALRRYQVLSEYLRFISGKRYGCLVDQKEEFCRRYNEGLMLEFDDVRDEIKHLTYQTLDNWKKKLDEAEGDTFALAPGYGKSRGKRSVTRTESEILERAYFDSRKTKQQAYIDMENELKRIGLEPNASYSTYMRYLDDFVRDNFDMATITREGEKAYNDKCLPYISRDYSRIEVGDILVADGHTCNFDVINPYTGKPFRPTIVVVTDFKSGMPLGWEIGTSENTQIIAMAYYRAIVTLGFVPRHFYLDNGRAFKAKYFTRAKGWKALPGLFERLKPYGFIGTKHALPYHGQSKPIERFFGTLSDFEQRRPGYRGNSIENKVPRLNRDEKLQDSQHNNRHKGAVDTINDVNMALVDWLINKYAVTPKAKDSSLKGRTPKEVYMESIEAVRSKADFEKRIITPDELRFLMLAQTKKKSGNNGIRMFGRYYWHEELGGCSNAKEFIVRFDFAALETVYVYDESGENFLFAANANGFAGIHPMADTLGTDEDRKRLREVLGIKGAIKQVAIRQAKEFYAARDAEEQRALPAVVAPKQLKPAKKAVGCDEDPQEDCENSLLSRARKYQEEQVLKQREAEEQYRERLGLRK